jgi:hypothetical protein
MKCPPNIAVAAPSDTKDKFVRDFFKEKRKDILDFL